MTTPEEAQSGHPLVRQMAIQVITNVLPHMTDAEIADQLERLVDTVVQTGVERGGDADDLLNTLDETVRRLREPGVGTVIEGDPE